MVIVWRALRVRYSALIVSVILRVEHQIPTALLEAAAMAGVPHVLPVKYWEWIACVTLLAGVVGTAKWARVV